MRFFLEGKSYSVTHMVKSLIKSCYLQRVKVKSTCRNAMKSRVTIIFISDVCLMD